MEQPPRRIPIVKPLTDITAENPVELIYRDRELSGASRPVSPE